MKEIPFSYILFNIMFTLKNRMVYPSITKNNLVKIIDIIIYNLSITEKEKLEIIKEFDFDYELDKFYNDYIEYFEMSEEGITLDSDTDIEQLEDFCFNNETEDIILSEIDDLLETNIKIIELMGIKIRKDIYNWLSLSMMEDEKIYNKLYEARKTDDAILSEKIVKEIKIHLFKRRIMLLNLNNLDIDETYDLMLYSDFLVDNLVFNSVPFNIENKSFNERNICCIPFQRVMFREDTVNEYYVNYKLGYDLDKCSNTDLPRYKDDYKFYLTYYYLLCEEINKLPLGKLRDELDKTKYKLMMLIDGIFDNNLFMNKDINNLDNYIGNYKSNELEAYFFTEELLSYEDSIYHKDTTYTLQYFNIIKKLFIKTYYNLTNDNNIITIIKENKYYGINKISTSYLDDIINNSRRKLKKTK